MKVTAFLMIALVGFALVVDAKKEEAPAKQAAPEAAGEQAPPEAEGEQAPPAEGEEENGESAEAEATQEGEKDKEAAAAEGEEEKKEEEKKEEKKDPQRPTPMSPAKDYKANQDLPPAERPEYHCEICMMVVGRKLQRHSLCDGLEHPSDQDVCRAVVEALTIYDRYVVDWLYGDGCQRRPDSTNVWKNVKPCPAHVVCSWMIHTFPDGEKRTFCQFEDAHYRRSPEFHAKHHIPTKEVEEVEQKKEEEEKPEQVTQEAEADAEQAPTEEPKPEEK